MGKLLAQAPLAARSLALVVAAVILLHLVAFAAVRILQGTMDGVLPGVTVLDEEAAGLDRSALQRTVQELADEHGAQPVVVTSGGSEIAVTRDAVGSRLDVTRTVEAAWEQGRSGLWGALFAHVTARLGDRREVARIATDRDALAGWTRDAAGRLSTSPRPPRVGFTVHDPPSEVGVDVVELRQGRIVDAEALAERLRAELADPGPVVVEAPAETVAPEIDQGDLEEAVARAETAVSAPVVLENPTRGDDLELTPEDLAAVLEVRPDASAPSGERLDVALPARALRQHLGPDRIDALEASATEASFAVVDDEVRIRGGRAGFEVFVEEAAGRILNLAREEAPREGELPGRRIESEVSRGEAEDLQIEEPVSSFTTEYPCCPPRVQNIHLIADMTDGALIRPGQRFELNDHVGPRTRERGFVAAPAIVGGEFVDVVGGGTSQFATTFFNAAFFAGIELDDFQPHSYYFERYPMGNEATISWGTIDLAIVNDSPYGILVQTSHTDTSVTVEFWSTPWAEVDIEREGPANVVEGMRRDGFDVTVRRLIEYPDGSTEVEEYSHTYLPQD